MAEVQSQPVAIPQSDSTSASAAKDALVARLDVLLEQYLHTLDEYQKARAQLSKQSSAGYLSLAQANFQNRSTTHYGQDSYDERMQAIRRVTVHQDEEANSGERIWFFIASNEEVVADLKETGSDESENAENLESSGREAGSSQSANKREARDPLRWFGILVPPALRSAQSSFTTAVGEFVPQLATIARDLRSQEIEIGRVRKQIKKL